MPKLNCHLFEGSEICVSFLFCLFDLFPGSMLGSIGKNIKVASMLWNETWDQPCLGKQFPFTKFYWADTCILTITVAKEESSSLKCENSGALPQWHLRRKHLLEVRCWFLSSFPYLFSVASGLGWGMRALCCPTAHGILVAPTRAWTRIPHIGKQILNHWTTR